MRIQQPAKVIVTCDVCGNDNYNTSYGSHLHLQRSALDFQGQPVADASVHRDLCPKCTKIVSKAINDACEGKGQSIPDSAVCFFTDGDRTCAVFGDFINLQESPAGFGPSFVEALDDLKKNHHAESKP